ncbi:MAG: glycerol-3-phosphate 1-O-acyltransferase PlsY [Verrucomicrobiales bacterium]
MSIAATVAVLTAVAYVVGATPFGYLVASAKGIDIRQHGSGNIGATNVIRVLGRRVGVPVFILDMLKGALPVIFADWWCSRDPVFAGQDAMRYLAEVMAGLGAVIGHNYTFWLQFKGGKGIATSAGVLLGVAPWVLLAVIIVWVLTFALWRYVSLASIVSGVALPLAVLAQGFFRGVFNFPLLALGTLMGALAVWRHRSNIARLRAGTEPRSGRGGGLVS